jgi:hypothetical protein
MLQANDPYRTRVRNAIRLALHLRRRNNLEELATDFGISSKTLSFLSNGRWSKTQRALIEVLLDACDEHHQHIGTTDAQPAEQGG